jgi:hypothetical protein
VHCWALSPAVTSDRQALIGSHLRRESFAKPFFRLPCPGRRNCPAGYQASFLLDLERNRCIQSTTDT